MAQFYPLLPAGSLDRDLKSLAASGRGVDTLDAVALIQVAQRAGVSLATASRALNGSDRRPAADIAERVRLAADALGYVANAQAQALARATTGLVGLVVHDTADPYFIDHRGRSAWCQGPRTPVLSRSAKAGFRALVSSLSTTEARVRSWQRRWWIPGEPGSPFWVGRVT